MHAMHSPKLFSSHLLFPHLFDRRHHLFSVLSAANQAHRMKEQPVERLQTDLEQHRILWGIIRMEEERGLVGRVFAASWVLKSSRRWLPQFDQ